ncbi:hypothetical protein CROQUDRAFT_684797 [Cronartium quercuum f. sp. fusiforme G11]|uniref:Uncharacterized protein n=1 Tax=Cronartium quercuum f. sp. fusiforme G11 TaxID=708437 RepID=A0A9P6TEX9_9BASI|nr:hypothetical protein CROQUDRAFT_684797 [Cronartium quercuum f. sp. fusiforme G11]
MILFFFFFFSTFLISGGVFIFIECFQQLLWHCDQANMKDNLTGIGNFRGTGTRGCRS